MVHLDVDSGRKVLILRNFTGKGKDSEKLNNCLKAAYLVRRAARGRSGCARTDALTDNWGPDPRVSCGQTSLGGAGLGLPHFLD